VLIMIDPLHIILAIVATLVVTLWVCSRWRDMFDGGRVPLTQWWPSAPPPGYEWRQDTFDHEWVLCRKKTPCLT
jgi:hypothetical protein